MIKLNKFFGLLALTIAINLQAQDTLRIMHYNLLNYGNYWGDCTTGNNNVNDKNQYLATIVDFVKPDIITVNEIDDASSYHDLLLNNALNVNGINYFARAYPPNTSGAPIMNEIYFNTEKLSLTSNAAVPNNYRDIDIFRFDVMNNQGKEIELNCVVAHLKAGNSNFDEETRANETNNLMLYLNNSSANGNYTMSGDFNIYGASEQAFQNLLFYPNEEIRFYDPINQVGEWHNNSFYAAHHTQSTHENGDCASGGGMDDRFDFILISDELRDGTDDIKYLIDSYQALGQDGEHFNTSLLSSPTNTTLPTNVLNALYNMSDHLPIVADFIVGENLGIATKGEANFNFSIANPASKFLELTLQKGNENSYSVNLSNIIGETLVSKSFIMALNQRIRIPATSLKNGFYLLTISHPEEGSITTKLLIKH